MSPRRPLDLDTAVAYALGAAALVVVIIAATYDQWDCFGRLYTQFFER